MRDDYYEPEEYEEVDDWEPWSVDEDLIEQAFQDPGGTSALRRATASNPRNLPCPTCGRPDRLTPKDRELGYQCDSCANQAERGW